MGFLVTKDFINFDKISLSQNEKYPTELFLRTLSNIDKPSITGDIKIDYFGEICTIYDNNFLFVCGEYKDDKYPIRNLFTNLTLSQICSFFKIDVKEVKYNKFIENCNNQILKFEKNIEALKKDLDSINFKIEKNKKAILDEKEQIQKYIDILNIPIEFE